MQIRRFLLDTDLDRLEDYLRKQYLVNHNMTSWLPERLHDLIYRMGAQESDGGSEKSMDHIWLWEKNGEIVAAILPDGENVYFSISRGNEHLFEPMLAYSEKNCLPLFHKADDGSVKFWVAVNDSLTYTRAIKIMITMFTPRKLMSRWICPRGSSFCTATNTQMKKISGALSVWGSIPTGSRPITETA